jgi:peroxiredoxin
MSYLIGPDGKIARVWPPKVKAAEHPGEVLAVV